MVLGGTDPLRVRLDECVALDPRDGAWRALPRLPAAVSGAAAAVAAVDGALVVVGGTPGDGGGAADGVCALLPGAGAWQPRASLPTPRSGLALVPLL